ncbi:MAG TPA: alpha/beta hydrolase domain-containing protein, partial [Gammaproteobacteria bacterium]
MARSKLSGLWLIFFGVWAASAAAEVVRIEVDARTDVAGGMAYGKAGPYEKLRGTLYFAVDPKAPANRMVTDLPLAPTNAAGRVEFRADFFLLKPKDTARGNGALLFEVSNRGGKGILPMLNQAPPSRDPTDARELGDGFLLEQGFSLFWVGWQLDPPPAEPDLLRVYPPVATGATGLVRSDFVVRTPGVRDHSLADGDHLPYPAADPDSESDTLTVRDTPLGERETVPREEWQFARVDGSGNVVPDATRVYLASGFTPKRIYEVVYTAANPPLAGLGLAAIRDAVTHLKSEGAPELGISAASYDRALAFGISQSGRLLRQFLYDGFNADERARRVFDGVLSHIAGGARGSFNVRFAQPSRSSSSYLYPNEVFPFSDAPQTDSVSGPFVTDGLLVGLPADSIPRIFYTNSSNEYWRGSAALTHTTIDRRGDLYPIPTTRIYHFAGTQHGPAAFPPRVGDGRLAGNPNAYSWFMRSLLLKLDAWVA